MKVVLLDDRRPLFLAQFAEVESLDETIKPVHWTDQVVSGTYAQAGYSTLAEAEPKARRRITAYYKQIADVKSGYWPNFNDYLSHVGRCVSLTESIRNLAPNFGWEYQIKIVAVRMLGNILDERRSIPVGAIGFDFAPVFLRTRRSNYLPTTASMWYAVWVKFPQD